MLVYRSLPIIKCRSVINDGYKVCMLEGVGIILGWVSVRGVGMGNKMGKICHKMTLENCVFGGAG